MGNRAQLHKSTVFSTFAGAAAARGAGRGGNQQRADSGRFVAECTGIHTRIPGVFAGNVIDWKCQ